MTSVRRARNLMILGLATALSTGCGGKTEAPKPGEPAGAPKAGKAPSGPPAISTEVAAATRVKSIDLAALTKADIKQPRSVRVDGNGNVYLVDYVGRQIVVLNAAGAVTNRWPFGKADILGIDVGPDGLLYALDTSTTKVTASKADGKTVKTVDLGTKNPAYSPRGFGVAPDGTFYLVDTGNGQLHHIGADGTPIKVVGGADPFKFKEPSDVAIAADGTVALADGDNKRVVILSANGDFVRAVGIPGNGGVDGIRLDKAENGFLAASVDSVWWIPKEGNPKAVAGRAAGNADEFQGLVAGVAWDAKEKVFYASDSGARTLKVFKLKS